MTTDQQTPIDISVQDLIVLHNLIQAAAQRGAIRPDEMTVVGSVYDKLSKFVAQATPTAANQ